MNAALASRPASSSIYSAVLLALIVLVLAMQASFVAGVLGGPAIFADASALDHGLGPAPCVPCDG